MDQQNRIIVTVNSLKIMTYCYGHIIIILITIIIRSFCNYFYCLVESSLGNYVALLIKNKHLYFSMRDFERCVGANVFVITQLFTYILHSFLHNLNRGSADIANCNLLCKNNIILHSSDYVKLYFLMSIFLQC